MNTYLYAMKTAFLFFPVIAFLIMLPYIISQYKKYGSILISKSILLYSFILYLVVIYFLVILPLPPIEEVKNYTNNFVQLKPFYTFTHIEAYTSFQFAAISTYGILLKNSYFYQFLYNIFITVPFGIYLRYYFKCSFKKTLLYSFLLSLFFELTQLSGLYGIYPRPYRIFDVDDLITNTFGGVLGYVITPLFSFFLPTRNQMDEKAYRKGENVSFLRRMVAFGIDLICFLFLLLILHFCMRPYFKNSLFLLLPFTLLLYYVLLPILYKGVTIGRYLVNIRLVSNTLQDVKWYQYLIREFFFFWIYIFGLPIIKKVYAKDLHPFINLFCILLGCLQIGIIFISIVQTISKNKKFYLYERMSHTKYISTIAVPIKEE